MSSDLTEILRIANVESWEKMAHGCPEVQVCSEATRQGKGLLLATTVYEELRRRMSNDARRKIAIRTGTQKRAKRAPQHSSRTWHV